jgi:hypothetical protein
MTTSARLERRYRLLLACFPRGYRRVYEDEMLGVLLAGARAGQNWPGALETLDLLRGALRQGVRARSVGFRQSPWPSTGSVVAAFAPFLALVIHAYGLAGTIGLNVTYVGDRPALGPSVWLPTVAWAAVALAAFAGPRFLAAGLAWAAALADAGVPALLYYRYSLVWAPSLWLVLLGGLAAVALTVSPGARDGVRILGWRRTVLLAIPGVAFGLAPVTESRLPGWLTPGFSLRTLPFLAGLAVAGYVLTRLDGTVRRRLLAVGALVAAGILIETIGESMYAADLLRPAETPALAVWFVLLAVPLLVFRLAVEAVGRRERTLRLVALGLAAERPTNESG